MKYNLVPKNNVVEQYLVTEKNMHKKMLSEFRSSKVGCTNDPPRPFVC